MARVQQTALNPLDIRIPYCRAETIHPKQHAFLVAWQREVFFGGATGPGKTVALAMAALQYVEVPRYAALLLRRTYRQLTEPGQLMDVMRTWLRGTDARFDGTEAKWYFPSGATIQMGHLDSERDLENYSGPEYQMIGFDELTQFPEEHYRFLFTRLRRAEGLDVPLRMRSASNPGGIGHGWVKQRFMRERHPDRLFLRARLEDNPSLDTAEYESTLSQLDPFTRQQMRYGDWDAEPPGAVLKREWLRRYTELPKQGGRFVFDSWDLTYGGETGTSYAVGQKWCRIGADLYLLAQIRAQLEYTEQRRAVAALAASHENTSAVVLEDAASARPITQDLKHSVPGIILRKPDGDKLARIEAVAPMAEAGNIYFPGAAYVDAPAGYEQTVTDELIERLTLVPSIDEWDEADALSQAVNYMRNSIRVPSMSPVSVTGMSSWRS